MVVCYCLKALSLWTEMGALLTSAGIEIIVQVNLRKCPWDLYLISCVTCQYFCVTCFAAEIF